MDIRQELKKCLLQEKYTTKNKKIIMVYENMFNELIEDIIKVFDSERLDYISSEAQLPP